MTNLLICSGQEAWESDTFYMPRDRCLTEYIMPELKSRFGMLGQKEIDELKQFPCIFAYEEHEKRNAYIGLIEDISVRQSNVKISYKKTGDVIPHDDWLNLYSVLDMGSWEKHRTHWTVKNVDIQEIVSLCKTSRLQKTTVFISYCWSPPSNQESVFELVKKLKADGISVKYDKDDLHPGQDKDYFMEQALTKHEIDFVLIICNSEYARRANDRKGGVGYESGIILSQIGSKPLQTKYIPVIFETDPNGQPYLPTFLTSRMYIDLTKENGYNELLTAIKKSNA